MRLLDAMKRQDVLDLCHGQCQVEAVIERIPLAAQCGLGVDDDRGQVGIRGHYRPNLTARRRHRLHWSAGESGTEGPPALRLRSARHDGEA